MAYATIDISWLPIVSITFSVMTILVSFLKTATHIFQDHPWYLRIVIFLSIFIFRMVTWVCLVILLVELIFIPIGIIGIANAAIMLIVQKNNISLEPVSHALQSLVFPFTKMIPYNNQDKENAKKIFIALTVFGNLLLAIVLNSDFYFVFSGHIQPMESQFELSYSNFKALVPKHLLEHASNDCRSNFTFTYSS